MAKSVIIKSEQQLPNCVYRNDPVLIKPSSQTPKHILPLSDIDDQLFLRFSIKYVFIFRRSIEIDRLKLSLSSVLVDYYPLAGRLRNCRRPPEDDADDGDVQKKLKLEVDCNGDGALFAEAFLDVETGNFLSMSNWNLRSLLYKPKPKPELELEPLNFIHLPLLIAQVTYLRCGGMILSTAINHCLCDGVGTSQFLHAWAHITSQSNLARPAIPPFHSRHVLCHQFPAKIQCTHPQYTKTPRANWHVDITKSLQSQPLITYSSIFTASQILRLKPAGINCTTFEALASHSWRSWIRSLDLPPSLHVKLLFPVNIRNKLLSPKMPLGYYGNAFVLGCAESSVNELAVADDLNAVVRLVQNAKSIVDDDYVNSTVLLLDDKSLQADLSASLVISDWSKLGLQDLDFGVGKPLEIGPLASNVFCLFLPVIGDVKAVRVLVSVPANVVEKFEYYMTGEYFSDEEPNV